MNRRYLSKAVISEMGPIWKEVPGLNGERLVLLNWENQPDNFKNLFKISAAGEILWVLEPKDRLDGVYVAVSFDQSKLTAWSYNCYKDTIDYDTGKILKRIFVK